MLGILTYPPRWFWDGTRRELHETRSRREPKVCFRGLLRGINFLAFEDGYVAMESDNRSTVALRLNGFSLGLTLLTGTPADPVTEPALETLELNSDGTRRPKGWSLVLAGNFVNSYDAIRKEVETVMMIFSTDELGVVRRFADKLVKRNRTSTVIRYLEARNQVGMGNWTSALALGWTTIEEMIDAELAMHLRGEGKPLRQASGMAHKMKEWEVIHELRRRPPLALGDPDPTSPKKKLLLEFDRLRRLRNKAVHGGRAATEVDARRMMKAAERAMWRMMRQQRVKYQSFLDEITPLQQARQKRQQSF